MSDTIVARRRGDEIVAATAGRYAAALIAGDPLGAARLLTAVREEGLSVPDLHAGICVPAARAVAAAQRDGRLDSISSAVAVAGMHHHLAALFPHALRRPLVGSAPALTAGLDGEPSAVVARVIADLLEATGQPALWLGALEDPEQLLGAVEPSGARVVVLCATEGPLGPGAALVADITRRGRRLAVVLDTPELEGALPVRVPREVASDAREAVAAVERLLVRVGRLRGVGAPAAAPPELSAPATLEAGIVAAAAQAAGVAREQTREAQRMRERTQLDPVSGCWNRAALAEQMRDLEGGTGAGLSILFIDIDHFKPVNDQYGHAAGDRVLARLGAALAMHLRPTDFAARYGGDEFVVLLHNTGLDDALDVADRLRELVAASPDEPRFTISIGVSPHEDDPERTLDLADEALYRAKRHGRNTIAVRAGPRPRGRPRRIS